MRDTHCEPQLAGLALWYPPHWDEGERVRPVVEEHGVDADDEHRDALGDAGQDEREQPEAADSTYAVKASAIQNTCQRRHPVRNADFML